MANCAQLLKDVNAARANWQVKHKASCNSYAPGHSPQCKGAYAYYTKKLAAWANACTKRSVDINDEDISKDERHALEKELDLAKDPD
jgi:hypothetical protein